jgi:hypothetical protein
MTVSVNAVSRPAGDMDQLSQAVGLAMKFYDLKLNADQQKAANGLLAKKAEEDARKEGAKFGGDHEAVTSRPAAGPFVPLDQAPKFAQDAAPQGAVGYVPASFGQRNRELDIAENTLNENRRSKKAEQVDKAMSDFENDGRIAKAKDTIGSADKVDELLTLNSSAALNAARMSIAKSATGVGALSDKEVDAFGGSQDLKSKAERLLAKATSKDAQFLPQDVEDLRAVNAVFRKSAQSQLKKEAERFADQKSSFLNLTKREIYDSLNLEPYYASQPTTQGQNSQGGLSAKQIAAQELLQEQQKVQSTGSTGSWGK